MGLARTLNLRNAIMLVVGNVVGAGIFTTSGLLAQDINDPFVFVGVWVLGGLLSLCGALTYAELGAMFPRAGGDYQYLKEAYGPWAGFLVGWLSFWIISPGSTAALSIALVGYLPSSIVSDDGPSKLLAVLVVGVLTVINYRSLRLASAMQDTITISSILLLVALVVGGAIAGNGSLTHFQAASQTPVSLSSVSGAVMISVIFTYSGWFAAAYVASEIKRPERNIPLALILGTLIVAVVYTSVNCIYLYALSLPEMAGITNVAQVAAGRLFHGPVTGMIALAIILAIASCINATVMTGSRICYAMAADDLFPAVFGKVHPRFSTPHVAVLAQGLLAVCLIYLSSFRELINYVVFAMLLSSIATVVAMIFLRVKRPEVARPYRAFGYPIVPIVFILAYGWIAVSVVINELSTSMYGLAMLLSGVPFYVLWKRFKRGPKPH
jgi:APA family basic amino acid/polyamine antiporter